MLLLALWPGNMELQAQTFSELAEDQEYNLQLDRAIDWQQKADSLYHISVHLRKQAAGMDDPLEKGRLQGKILTIEDSMNVFMERADSCFAGLNHPFDSFIILDTVLNGIRIYRYNLEHEFFTKSGQTSEEENITELPAKTNTGKDIEFEMYMSSVYNDDNLFENDFIPGEGTFYRIQLAVFSSQIAPDHFGGLFPVTTERIPDKDMTRYFAGKFTHLDDAEKALRRVRSAGYPDAFIVGYYNGVKSTPEKLRTLEKE